MTYIIRRGALYYLNLRLPKLHSRDCHTLRMSLGVRDRKTALFLAAELARNVHNHITSHPMVDLKSLRSLCVQWMTGAPHVEARLPSSTTPKTSVTPLAPNNSLPLSTLAKLYVEEGKRGGIWRTVSAFEVERALANFFDLMGDMPATTFGPDQARLLKDRLSRCPQYFDLKPEFKGKTLRQVIDSGKKYQTITPVTVNNRLRKQTAFLNWCKSNGYITENPLSGLRVMTGAVKDARISFAPEDLSKLLDLDSLKHEAKKHPWRYWLPLIARFTGCRLEEICQLHTDDLMEVQGIPCIRVDDKFDGQKLKTESSRRVLPIHSELVRLGLLDYAQLLRSDSEVRLFPELVRVRDKLGHAPSKWFGKYKLKHGISDPRKTFHSFRHTFIDDLRDAEVQDSLIKRMVGHEDTSVTFGLYGSRTPTKAMQEALRGLSLPKDQ